MAFLRLRNMALTTTVFVVVSAEQASGDYILRPLVGGSSQASVLPGESFTIDFVLSGGANDRHDACEFLVVFSSPGFFLNSYAWRLPYSMLFDLSTPSASQLPVDITASLLQGGSLPEDEVDIVLSNLTDSGDFGSGVLVSMSLQVPLAWSGPDVVDILVIPELFSNGFAPVVANAAESLTVTIPVPSALSVLAIHPLFMTRRRRV